MPIALLLFVVGLVLFLMRAKGVAVPGGFIKPDYPKDSSYTKRTEGAWTRIDTTPARAPKRTGFFFFIGLSGLILAGLIGALNQFVGAVVGAPIVGIAIWWGLFRDLRPAPYRRPGSFRVSPDAIETEGTTLKKSDIHRLVMTNGLDKEKVISYSLQAPGAADNAAATLRHYAAVQEVACGVTAEAGGKRYVLAGGLTETTAYAVLSDACKVLDFETVGG